MISIPRSKLVLELFQGFEINTSMVVIPGSEKELFPDYSDEASQTYPRGHEVCPLRIDQQNIIKVLWLVRVRHNRWTTNSRGQETRNNEQERWKTFASKFQVLDIIPHIRAVCNARLFSRIKHPELVGKSQCRAHKHPRHSVRSSCRLYDVLLPTFLYRCFFRGNRRVSIIRCGVHQVRIPSISFRRKM